MSTRRDPPPAGFVGSASIHRWVDSTVPLRVIPAHVIEETARHESFSRYRHGSLTYPLLDVMQVDARTWELMWGGSQLKEIRGLPVRVPAVIHLIALKLHAIRQNPDRELQDADDIVRLLRVNAHLYSNEDLRAVFERYQLLPLLDKVLSLL